MAGGLPAERYVDALKQAIDDATRGFTPDLVMISAGFDSLRGDPLGGFTLEIEHIGALTRLLVERSTAWCEGRLVSALEGGYAPDRVGEACVAHMKGLQ
jgi:acetoin utilization deacetylase AcuC-like enzyme